MQGNPLSSPEYEGFWRECESLGTIVMLHPLITEEFPLMAGYHLNNLVGNPWQTTAAACDLIFSGVFCRYPRLKVLLVHGGGFLPYQIGRMEQSCRVRPECRARLDKSPREVMKTNLYFYGLTHSRESLELLLKTAGVNRVLYGSDYPYDMAEYDQREKLETIGLSPEEIDQICQGNAKKLLRR